MDIQTRLKEFLRHKKLTYKDFELKAGLANATASRIGENSRSNTFIRVSKAFPDLNIQWLKTGEGEMLNPNVASPSFDVSPDASNSNASLLDLLRSQQEMLRSQQETIRSLSETVRQLAKGGN